MECGLHLTSTHDLGQYLLGPFGIHYMNISTVQIWERNSEKFKMVFLWTTMYSNTCTMG